MLIVEIVRDAKSRVIREGQPNEFTIRFHEADMIEPNRTRPRPVEIPAPRGGYYPPGNYVISGGSFRTNEYDGLVLDRYVDLMPLKDALAYAKSVNSK